MMIPPVDVDDEKDAFCLPNSAAVNGARDPALFLR